MSVIELAQRLVQFKTTHEHPEIMEECLAFCADFFKGHPVSIKRYLCQNVPSLVIQTHDTLEKDLILLGHIDTVPGDEKLFAGKIENGNLYGRGTLDMKAFVATSMTVMKELLDEGYKGNIALFIVTDEELGGKYGARYLVQDLGYRAPVVLVPDDGEDIQAVVTETKHILQVKFLAQGKEAHGCRPWAGVNAIELLIKTFEKLRRHFSHQEAVPQDIWVCTTNLGVIHGGSASNEVPAEAHMMVDIRITKEVSKEDAVRWIKEALVPGVSYEIVMEGYPTILEQGDPVLKRYTDEIRACTGKEARYIRSGGATDGRYFAQKGMKVIVHQGTGGQCQSDEEHVELESLISLVQIQKNFIRKLV